MKSSTLLVATRAVRLLRLLAAAALPMKEQKPAFVCLDLPSTRQYMSQISKMNFQIILHRWEKITAMVPPAGRSVAN